MTNDGLTQVAAYVRKVDWDIEKRQIKLSLEVLAECRPEDVLALVRRDGLVYLTPADQPLPFGAYGLRQ